MLNCVRVCLICRTLPLTSSGSSHIVFILFYAHQFTLILWSRKKEISLNSKYMYMLSRQVLVKTISLDSRVSVRV